MIVFVVDHARLLFLISVEILFFLKRLELFTFFILFCFVNGILILLGLRYFPPLSFRVLFLRLISAITPGMIIDQPGHMMDRMQALNQPAAMVPGHISII